ncbi:MAG: response regulator [Anaerolineae bacterium]|nr:response regulator [Anaerolineae bacterium]
MKTSLSVLYVEDDQNSQSIMSFLLTEALGLTHVNIFENSENFMNRVHALTPRPEVILLDIHLKPYNGFEMLQMLRADSTFNGTPIVALTASVMNEEVQQLKTAGFNGVIAKPIDIDTFPMLLERVLNGEAIWGLVHA